MYLYVSGLDNVQSCLFPGKGLTILGSVIEGKYQERKTDVEKVKEVRIINNSIFVQIWLLK